ncbi:MAG: ketopantoate reductase family protein [Microbacteriaceae bacterium]|nr:ketopantoate reductase family protein [Microbacteriaceae bacterium]
MAYLIIGAGGIGASLAARLVRGGAEVTLVARPNRTSALAEGITMHDFDGTVWRSRPTVVDALPSAVGDPRETVVVLAVKAFDTPAVVQQLAQRDHLGEAAVICAQNTVHNEATVAKAMTRVAGAVVHFGADVTSPGVITDRGDPPLLVIGGYPNGMPSWLDGPVADLRSGGFIVETSQNVMARKWSKLILNLDSALSAIASVSNDEMRSDPRWVDVRRAVRAEALRALDAAGIEYERPIEISQQPSEPWRPRSYSSTWHDLRLGRSRVETDDINGEIVRIGVRTGVPVPLNVFLLETCVRMALERTQPGAMTPDELLRALAALRA